MRARARWGAKKASEFYKRAGARGPPRDQPTADATARISQSAARENEEAPMSRTRATRFVLGTFLVLFLSGCDRGKKPDEPGVPPPAPPQLQGQGS